MTSRFTCFMFLFTFFSSNAQINIISTGSGYSKQSFYNLATQEEFQLNNDGWDIAFSNVGQTDAGIFINESASSTGTPLKLFLAPTTDWATPLNDASIYVDSLILYNKELNWTEGAFNAVADHTSPFDYGWGAYNPQNHSIQGNKIFVIKGRDGSFKKIQIVSLQGGNYTIKYADLNGANEETKTIAKSTEQYGSTIFFSLKSGEVVATPKEYDLMFLRYYAPLDAGNGEILEYAVTGILLAPGVEAVNVTGIDPETVDEADYKDQYTDLPSTIGHDWKRFDFSAGWIVTDDQVFFIKTKAKDKYKLVFIDFEGSQTGTAAFEATFLQNTSSSTDILDAQIKIYPNPTSDFITIETTETQDVSIDLFTTTGQRINSFSSKTNSIISLSEYTNYPMLMLRAITNGNTFVKTIIVNK